MRHLSTLTRAQGANRALIDGEVTPSGLRTRLRRRAGPGQGLPQDGAGARVRRRRDGPDDLPDRQGARRRVHRLPSFLVRDLHHGATGPGDGPIKTPKDLAGSRVGVNRGYTVTTGVWGRASLADGRPGCRLDDLGLSGDEHVASYRPPSNVVSAPVGSSEEMLLSRRAGRGRRCGDRLPRRRVADPRTRGGRLGGAARARRPPINHLVVIRDDLLAEQPDSRRRLRRVRRAKQPTSSAWGGPRATRPTGCYGRSSGADRDPLPYGIEPNRPGPRRAARPRARPAHPDQAPSLDDVFAASTLRLHG